MKCLIAAALAVASLTGCVAVPYYAGPPARGYHSYGPPVPPATLYFRYDNHRHRR